jgi:hypothetical protein
MTAPRFRLSGLVLATIALAFLNAKGAAQCDPQWAPGDGVPGTNGAVTATTRWDPDGPGPLSPVLVVGGTFTIAGNVAANRVALYDQATGNWSALGAGTSDIVDAFATLPTGELVAAGYFTSAGGSPAQSIAKWNGTAWSSLGAFDGPVFALALLANGDLVAAGFFSHAGGIAANSIARWNGIAWSPMGSGFASQPGSGQNGSVYDLLVMPNGDLVASGFFYSAGGVVTPNVARWNGVAWSSLGVGIQLSAYVFALALLPNGDIVAGGTFATAWGGPGNRVARWNGSAWLPLGSGLDNDVYELVTMPNGDLVAGGFFQNAGAVPTARLARWDGSTWSALGSGCDGGVNSLGFAPNGDLVAGGGFTSAGGRPCGGIATWASGVWSPLSRGIDGEVAAVLALPAGGLVAGGYFTAIGGVDSKRVATFDGLSWSPLGAGFDGGVRALARLPNGDIVAGGAFASSGTTAVNNVARWNGTAWLALGTGVSGGHVEALAVLPNGDLVAGGSFTLAGGVAANRVAKWNGISWSPLSTGLDSTVYVLLVRANGDLVAGGSFWQAGGVVANGVAQWNGSTWSPLASGLVGTFGSFVLALAELPNAVLVAGGWFTTAASLSTNRIAQWNGFYWAPLGSGITGNQYSQVEALHVLPNGDLVAAGDFAMAGGVGAPNIARWNGSVWSPIAGGTNGPVRCLASLTNGDVVAGGAFFTAGGAVSSRLARLVSPCPASAAPFGSGCAGSGGLNVLTATSLPWTGSTFTSLGTGMPVNGLALSVLGLSTVSIPLPLILPQGVAGCTLLVSPDLLDLLLPSAGTAQARFAIPNTVALAGQLVHEQVVPFELGALGITALTSTNALTMTIGTW